MIERRTPSYQTLKQTLAWKASLKRTHFFSTRTTMPSAVSDESVPAIHTPPISPADLESFSTHLQKSSRILALCGAGLSAASGLPTFRGSGGYWRNNDAISLASLEAFQENPSLVWQFYSYRRHMSLKAQPNKAHLALAELARKKQDFLTISQNVDGLSQRTQHPQNQLELLHGSLSTVKCTNFDCDYVEYNNFTDPIVPALEIPKKDDGTEPDISDSTVPMKDVDPKDLPHCPKCTTSLLRPGVVWFGEALPSNTLRRVDEWVFDRRGIDLIIVVGTSASVYPAAGYIMRARAKGARVAVINTERPDQAASQLQEGDWFFQGDAGKIMPQILESVIGDVSSSNERS